MSLHFNWSRLDETCAEALRQLINTRLAEVVERVNQRSSPQTGNAGPAAAAAGGGGGGGGGKTGGTSSGGSGVAGRPELSQHDGVSHESMPVSGAAPGHWEFMADPSVSSTLPSPQVSYSGAMTPSTGMAAALPCHAVAGGAGGGGATGTSGAAVQPLGGTSSGRHGAGASPAAAEVGSSTHHGGVGLSKSASFAVEPPPVPATAAYRTSAGVSSHGYSPLPRSMSAATPTTVTTTAAATAAAAGSAGAGGVGVASSTSGSPASPSPTTEARGNVPPIVYMEVGRIEWGTTSPFVELVAFENAIDGPPGRPRARPSHQPHGRGVVGGGRDGASADTRLTSPFSASHATSMDTVASPCTTAAAEPGVAGLSVVVDTVSESSHGLASRPHTRVNTPRVVAGTHVLFDASGSGGAAGVSSVPQLASASLSQFPSLPEPPDPLAAVLGPGGLYLRFHMTYGGAMHLSLNIAVQHELRLGAVALRVSLPMMFYLANLDLDCYVCVNVKGGMCEVWLEPGPLSPFILNRLSITATIGGDDDDGDGSDVDAGGGGGGGRRAGTGDYGTSSTDFYSRFGSSSISDDDRGGEEDSGVYVNEHEVSQFILHELRAILRETLVAPHSIRVPVSFGSSGP
ncbi:hypothetical protein NESM_000397900 [Novymonas esmeraldas]|uniref:SMP-LTD domain-containing protein n=1 Tax=Novymonas esmeraldas TaxID=1808958 RepID=A0AAW0EPJ2_9TRYP